MNLGGDPNNSPPPLEGGGWGDGSGADGPLPPTPSLKGRGSLITFTITIVSIIFKFLFHNWLNVEAFYHFMER